MALINALLPLVRPLQITSLNQFSVTSTLQCITIKRLRTWNAVSILLVILLIGHVIYDSDFYSDSQPSIGKTIIFIKLCTVRLAHLTILMESFVHRSDLIAIMDILSLVDVKLMKTLGIDVGHNGLKKLILWALIINSLVFMIIEGSVLAVFLSHSFDNFVIFWLARLVSYSVIFLRYLQMFTFIYILRSRLSTINSSLAKIYTDIDDEPNSKFVSMVGHLEDDNRDIVKMRNKKFRNFDEITVLRKLFGNLWEVSNLINSCFGISLLACVGNDFATVTLNGYWIYLSYKQFKNVTIICSIALWSIPPIICMVLLAGFCYSTVEKANETALIVHKIDNNTIHGTHEGLRTREQQAHPRRSH